MGMPSPTELSLHDLVEDLMSMFTTLDPEPSNLDYVEHGLVLARCRVRTLKNVQQPVNRLAPEVLSQIFMLLDPLRTMDCLDDLQESGKQSKALLTITWVCRRWRYIALFTQGLWNHIHIRHPTDQAAIRSLSLSGNMPLVIYHLGKQHKGGKRRRKLPDPDAFEMAMSHLHRVEGLYIKGYWGGDSVYWEALNRGAPMLKCFHFMCTVGDPSDPPPLPELFSGSCPSLERLCISTYTLLPQNQFRNLKCLVLHAQHNNETEHIGFPQFLPTLASSSPQLEELTICRGLLHTRPRLTPVPHFSDNPVHLPNLRTLTLESWLCNIEDVPAFLSCICIPNDASRHFFASASYPWLVPLTSLIQLGGIPNSPTRRLRKFNIIASRVIQSHAFSLEREVLTITRNIDPTVCAVLLASGLLSDVEESVLVTLPQWPPSIDDLHILFAGLPSLRHLTISGDVRGILPRVTKALGLLDDPATLGEGPPCPLLESLDVLYYPGKLPLTEEDDTCIDGLLVAMLAEQRARRGYPLKRVVIERCHQEHFKLLERCVDEVVGLKRWQGCPLGYCEESFFKDVYERTRMSPQLIR